MKTKYIFKGLIASLFLIIMASSCENYIEPLIDGLDPTRAFSPVDLKATVRNQTFVELNWTAKADVNHYVVEFSADDTSFATIYKTIEVSGSQLPVTAQLEGETLYSIRVKAVSSIGLEDSKWSVTTANTLSEQIFLQIQDGDIQAKQATLRWIPNSNVTQIVMTPGAITHVITPEEKTAGVATVTGLSPETIYTADLLNNTKKRGSQIFTTGIDIGTGILVKPTDNLLQIIADAESGAILVLEPGDYRSQLGSVSLSKSITIRGLRSYDKPLLKLSFSLNSGAANVNLIDLNLTGDVATNLVDVVRYSTTGNYGSLLISGCTIHDYDRSLVAGNATNAKVESVTVENSTMTNVDTGTGGDFIDFRNTYVTKIDVKTSTFNNCATVRDFFRVDEAIGLSGTGLTTTIFLDHCTLYKTSNLAAKRILYVRFGSNVITVSNTLFAETVAIYSNQSKTSLPSFVNNNYFNTTGLYTTTTIFDASTTYTTLDPQFVDAAAGNFKVQNQAIIDKNVGDPRWLK